ncbi:MAG: hypothetical protein VX265_10460 [Myxococcota bacterium]|nr:hypothetical protein [Myxococcota bacterium]MEC8424711.1 hypothetical protein [Myxococcota bacterium]
MHHTILLLATIHAVPAHAGGDVAAAEHDRVADEMERLAERKIWAGVERNFRELESLDASLTFDDLLIGAHAARELGDVASAYARLKAASGIKSTREIVSWLSDIDNNYGHVDLVAVPARSAELSAVQMPFDPNQRRAVDAAVKRSKQDGAFRGLLPAGGYSFASQKFEVVPGISVKIEVSPRMRRQGLIDPVIIVRDSPGAVLQAAPTQKDD